MYKRQINRLGLDDTFEEGKSLTLGVEYKKTDLNEINKFFEAKIETEKFITYAKLIELETIRSELKNKFNLSSN